MTRSFFACAIIYYRPYFRFKEYRFPGRGFTAPRMVSTVMHASTFAAEKPVEAAISSTWVSPREMQRRSALWSSVYSVRRLSRSLYGIVCGLSISVFAETDTFSALFGGEYSSISYWMRPG